MRISDWSSDVCSSDLATCYPTTLSWTYCARTASTSRGAPWRSTVKRCGSPRRSSADVTRLVSLTSHNAMVPPLFLDSELRVNLLSLCLDLPQGRLYFAPALEIGRAHV